MKKTLLVALLILACSCNVNQAQAQDGTSVKPQEVYINLDTVWRSSDKGKQDLADIDKLVEDTRAEVKGMQDEMKQLGEEFKATTDENKKKELAKNIEIKRRQLIETSTMKNREIEMKKNQAQQEFVKEIVPLINKYRQDNGYLVIHRYTANDIISLDPNLDITEEILKIYSK